MEDQVRALIRDIPDFPKPGILFKDIAPLLKDSRAMKGVIDHLADAFRDEAIDTIASPESRGFLFGVPLALELGCGFVPVRKPGKLPYETRSLTYDLEYGTDTVEIHTDAAMPGDRILLVDDVLATGGTMAACAALVESVGASVVGCAFLLELGFLEGRGRLKDYRIETIIRE